MRQADLFEPGGVGDQNFLAIGCFLPGNPLPKVIRPLNGIGHNLDCFIVGAVIQNRPVSLAQLIGQVSEAGGIPSLDRAGHAD